MQNTIDPNVVKEVAENLTLNERKFLQLCLNYDNIDSQLSDNYSNGGMTEAVSLFNGNKHAGAGLLSSLTQKKLGYADDGSDWGQTKDTYYHTFWLSELGVRVAFASLNYSQ